MALRIKERIERKFGEEIRFIRGMMDKPKTVGAIVPTSSVTARKMASVINPASGLPVLELGPGTGVITRAILERGVPPEKLHAIEYSEDFLPPLIDRFPGVDFIHGDAFHLERTLAHLGDQKFDAVISGLPLLNFPMHQRVSLLESLLDRLPEGRPVVQFSYGPVSPIVAQPDRYRIQHFDFIVRNIPPAQIWLYRRP
ncbi:phospholipid N-methyltransferase PmtA [Gellertiella hungarica]|uniref:Phosphatidylethanolamine/phosphatidyl-N-methylethanolamine N-methyltransferase n=1 Tax=Gellertiella hungarica TaxID=1572859 RepID=A0A7W6J4H4_9HYPH|nr:class I SAM-dependent methyltransferase [Gellertiella hungarica]MBB4063741.1 phosphatidylethanolamine/phosphatidyl-N-methylethanolamine N-methyltransferase [Gellertiella hungarica]